MNKNRWKNEDHSNLEFTVKLAEECGEVAKATLDYEILDNHAQLKSIFREIEHVEFIAQCYRERLEQKVLDKAT